MAHVDIHTIRTSLKRLMAAKEIKPTALSLAVGTNKSLVKDLLEKTDDVKISTLNKLADALEVDITEILDVAATAINEENVRFLLSSILPDERIVDWSAPEGRRLSVAVARGLEFLGNDLANPASPDLIVKAVRSAEAQAHEVRPAT